MKFFEIKERIWQEIDNEWRVKILGGGIVPLHQSIHNQQVDAKALEWGNDVVTNRIFELGTTLRVFLSDFRHDRVRNYVASLSDKAGISFVEKFLNRIYEINPKRIINTRIKWMGLPAEVFFFPFEVEVTGTSSEPAEVLIGLFCCLATTAMALRNVADEVDMPSTLEYGNKRTCGLGGWTAVYNKNNERLKGIQWCEDTYQDPHPSELPESWWVPGKELQVNIFRKNLKDKRTLSTIGAECLVPTVSLGSSTVFTKSPATSTSESISSLSRRGRLLCRILNVNTTSSWVIIKYDLQKK